jgi:hypothetical protein
MKRNTIILLFLALVVGACSYDNIRVSCYHGKVIGTSCCTGTSFIALDAITPIGKPMVWGGVQYQNVVQVPGFLNSGNVYLDLRAFEQSDGNLLSIYCYCLVAEGQNVPLWVATRYSYTACGDWAISK